MSSRSRFKRPIRPTNGMAPSHTDPIAHLEDQRDLVDEREDDPNMETWQDGEEVEEYTIQSYVAHQVILLPSGKHIRVRPVSVTSLFRRGEIPNNLIPAAKKILGFTKEGKANQSQADADYLDLIDFLTCKMIASFRVVDKRHEECGPDEVSVDNILECDKLAILQFSQQGQAALNAFR